MTAPALLRGVDLAAFAAALVARLRAGGVTVAASGPAAFVAAMRELVPTSRNAAVLGGTPDPGEPRRGPAGLRRGLRGGVRRRRPAGRPDRAARPSAARQPARFPRPGIATTPARRPAGCPGPPVRRHCARPTPLGDAAAIPDVLPSRIVARAEEPFETFDDADLRLIGTWLEQAVALLADAAHAAHRNPPARQADRPARHHAGLPARPGGNRWCWPGLGHADGGAGWCWCATSAGRCSRTRRSICT